MSKFKQKLKKGSAEIIIMSLGIIFFTLILAMLFVCYVQINSLIYPVKQDLFYIVQNAFLAINLEELSYSNYNIDEAKLYDKVNNIINLNYPNQNIKLNYIKYDNDNKLVHIEVILKIAPIISLGKSNMLTITLKDDIKLKEMEVVNGSQNI